MIAGNAKQDYFCERDIKMKITATLTLTIFMGSLLHAQSITQPASVNFSTVPGLGRLHGINANGQSVGYLFAGDDVKAFSYQNGNVARINIPNADTSIAYGIENNGRIVGKYSDDSGTHGFLYFNGNVTTINYPGGATYTICRGMNDNQQIAGYYKAKNGIEHAFYYDKKGFTPIPEFSGAVGTHAMSINNPGDVVGYYTLGSGGDQHDHGFLYDKKGNLTTVDVPFNNVTDTRCYGINSSGLIVGTYDDNLGTHGFLDIAGLFFSVDAPGGTTPGIGTFVQGINDNNQITAFGITAFLGNILQ